MSMAITRLGADTSKALIDMANEWADAQEDSLLTIAEASGEQAAVETAQALAQQLADRTFPVPDFGDFEVEDDALVDIQSRARDLNDAFRELLGGFATNRIL